MAGYQGTEMQRVYPDIQGGLSRVEEEDGKKL